MDKLTFTQDICEGIAVFHLCGSIDHHTVKNVREEIDRNIYRLRPHEVVLDLNDVEFMDSSGLGLILGRYTRISDLGGALTLVGMSDEVMKIIRLSGADSFIRCEKKSEKERMIKNA